MSEPSAVTGGVTGTVQLIKTDRSKLTLIDEEAMMKQVEATHAPDEYDPHFNVRTILNFVQGILSLAASTTTIKEAGKAHPELFEKCRELGYIPNLQALRNVVDKITRQIWYKGWGRGNDDETVLVFKMLSGYTWEEKLVVTMAAFALNYAESYLLAQAYSSNPFAMSMEFFRQFGKPFILEFREPSKAQFDAQFDELINVLMDVTNCVVEFKELPSIYISSTEVPEFTQALASIPMAVYRVITSIVACATWINNLPKMSNQSTTTVPWDLAKLQGTHELLKTQVSSCQMHIEEKRNDEAYIVLLNLYDKTHTDNMKILKDLIYSKDDTQPLVDGSTKRRVSLDVLRRKNVLLLISGLDISHDELSILEQIYNESRIHATRLESQYLVVWIPIVDRTVPYIDAMHKQFEALQATMPWYTVHHPTMVEKVVIRFIKEVWHFRNKPILVVLDPQGKVVCPNALHMMWIWGSNAFPFTTLREESLWKEESWRLELLIDGIDPTILNWIIEGKYIFLYGGDDIEWIRKFTIRAKEVARAAGVPLEMVYVGKSTKRERVQRAIKTITDEKLSYVWEEVFIWFFWIRIENMLFSKIQLRKIDEHETMMQEIKKLLSYDREGGWAALCEGSNVVVNGHSTTILQTLIEYDMWKQHIPHKSFGLRFKEYHDKLYRKANHCCCQFDFPTDFGRVPQRFICPHCSRNMEKFITFSCCNDEDIWKKKF